MDEHSFDVVVVGCGIAGLAAAVSAQERGVRVAVLERAPVEERGGNTRYTGAWMRMKSDSEVSDDFEEHFATNGGGHVDPTLIKGFLNAPGQQPGILRALSHLDPNVIATFAAEAPATMAWLMTFGIRFIPLPNAFPTSVQPRIQPSGGGLGLIEALAPRLEKNGGTIFYQTTARSLIQNASGAVVGVDAVGRGNRPMQFRAGAVVLACGGFEGNAHMLTHYIGQRAVNLRTMSLGSHYNKGEGIRMALDIGAAPCGDFGLWHSSPMDPRTARAGSSVYIYPYGILVNNRGQRFVDEAPGSTDETYESVAREIASQPNGIAYVVVDAKLEDVPNYKLVIYTEQPAIEAATLFELAGKLAIPVSALEATVASYNNACVPGTFKPREVDRLATQGIHPEKSNWARPIDRPPFKAYPIVSSIVFTFGGLKVNTSAQVLNTDGDPIPGLYAAGETMGTYYNAYTGATSVMKGAVFGRIAGLDSARVLAGR
ncbi:MAG: FAD-dependent oxidoreductase [Betaproteobacteria bacterium]|nr:FAD-dependent oxidoreductase [Betaproteobacteria bacterium]